MESESILAKIFWEKVFSACRKMLEKCINSGENIPEPRIPFGQAGIPLGGGILEKVFRKRYSVHVAKCLRNASTPGKVFQSLEYLLVKLEYLLGEVFWEKEMLNADYDI